MGAWLSKPDSFPPYNDFLTLLPDDCLLSNILLVGTHNSSAYNSNSVLYKWINCQSHSISSQLAMGVRVFDIRCCLINNGKDLQCYHGAFPLASTFENVCREMQTFLEANPREVVFVKLQNENCYGGEAYLEAFKNHFDKRWWRNHYQTQYPKLGECRGKIVLFDRFDGFDARFGLSWGLVDQRRERIHKGLDPWEFPSTDALKESICNRIVLANQSKTWFEMPLTGSVMKFKIPLWPSSVAAEINSWFLARLVNEPKMLRHGIVFVDFCKPELVQLLNRVSQELYGIETPG